MSYDISSSLSYFTQHHNQSRDFVAMLSLGDQTSSIYPSPWAIRTHIANTGVKEKNDPSNICMAFVTKEKHCLLETKDANLVWRPQQEKINGPIYFLEAVGGKEATSELTALRDRSLFHINCL